MKGGEFKDYLSFSVSDFECRIESLSTFFTGFKAVTAFKMSSAGFVSA
jgi:hypothetical protein